MKLPITIANRVLQKGEGRGLGLGCREWKSKMNVLIVNCCCRGKLIMTIIITFMYEENNCIKK